MRVLVVGAGGFIGRRIARRLRAAGHDVVSAGRKLGAAIAADLSRDDVADWVPRLDGIAAVINAAGILRGDLAAVHHRGMVALFDACHAAGISRLLHISALGADPASGALFQRTRGAADEHLWRLARAGNASGWVVLRPSLVIGRGGASTARFLALAAAWHPVRMARGTWPVQPIHVDDVAGIVVQLLGADAVPLCLDLVGPEAMTTDRLTMSLRDWLGLPPRSFLTLPASLLRLSASLGDRLPGAVLTTETLGMLARGNVADVAPLRKVLGWAPRHLAEALAGEPASAADLLAARMAVLRPFVLATLAAIWIGTGLASALLPAARATELLARTGLAGWSARAVTLSGAALDLALGVMLLHRRWRRPVALAQVAVVGVYTLLATISLPGLWADPFAPLVKNLAVIAATWVLLVMEA